MMNYSSENNSSGKPTQKELFDFFESTTFFKNIPADFINEFVNNCVLKNYAKGQTILKEGETNNELFFIYAGEVEIVNEQNRIAVLVQGKMFGERSLLSDGLVRSDLKAYSNVKLLLVNQHLFFAILQNNPQILKNLITVLLDRVSDTNSEIIASFQKREETLKQLVAERTAQLQEKNLQLELKNTEITDSINYAKTLQLSIMPELSEVKQNLNAFVFYQPKDIVAGDFYWMERSPANENIVYIAAADCTGHGVPGAFTSVICSQKLSDVVSRGIKSPAKILEEVNKEIKKVFKHQNKDGMDCALVAFNKNDNKILFSGANRPLWLYKDREKEIVEYKSNKFSIGHSVFPNTYFEEWEIPTDKNDIIYIFTDGYQDQFGGENGKKLRSAKLKEILLSIAQLSFGEQKTELFNAYKTWMGTHEQVDDVLIIGIKCE